MNNDKQILVGKIVAMQGVRGDVRVQTYTENPKDFQGFQVHPSRSANGGNAAAIFNPDDFRFIRVVPNTNVIIAHIRGFEDRTSAEALRGTELFVERDALPGTRANEYYQADLIGFTVMRDGENLGIIECFQNFGAGDIIETRDGNMYSFKGAIVDFDNKTVNIK